MSITKVEPMEDADLGEEEPMIIEVNRDPNNLNAHLQVNY